MPTTDPIATVQAQLSIIDGATSAIQKVVGTYPSGTAGVANVELLLADINTANASLKALLAAAQPTPAPTPVPVPVPQPTPIPPTPTPVPPASGVIPLVHDDFTTYGSTAALQAVISKTAGGIGTGKILYQDGWYANLVSLDTSVPYNGHPTAKLNMPGGQKNCPKLVANLPGAYDKIWFRTKIRYSSGFKITGTTPNSANAYKALGWGHDTYDGSGRLEVVGTQYQLYWTMQAKGSGSVAGGGKYLLDGSVASEWTDGLWYDYILCIDRTKGTQGFASWWLAIDGQTPIYRGITPAETMNNGSQLPHLINVQFSMEFNQTRAANQTQALWLGSWEAIDGVKYPNPYNVTNV